MGWSYRAPGRRLGACGLWQAARLGIVILILALGGYHARAAARPPGEGAQGRQEAARTTIVDGATHPSRDLSASAGATGAPGNWTPFLHAIPSSDGTAVDVCLMMGGSAAGGVHSTMYQAAWTAPKTVAMTRLPVGSADDYIATFPGFDPGVHVQGWVRITATLTLSADHPSVAAAQILDTGPTSFERAYVAVTSAAEVVSGDGNLVLQLSPGSFPTDAYLIVMPTPGLPGPLPLGHVLVGRPYALRTSGAIVQIGRSALLEMFFAPEDLGEIDPSSLRIAAWDPVRATWDTMGTVSLRDYSVSAATSRLTVYALVAPVDLHRLHMPLAGRNY